MRKKWDALGEQPRGLEVNGRMRTKTRQWLMPAMAGEPRRI